MSTPDPADMLRQRVLVADTARLAVAIVSMTIGLDSILVQWMRGKTQAWCGCGLVGWLFFTAVAACS